MLCSLAAYLLLSTPNGLQIYLVTLSGIFRENCTKFDLNISTLTTLSPTYASEFSVATYTCPLFIGFGSISFAHDRKGGPGHCRCLSVHANPSTVTTKKDLSGADLVGNCFCWPFQRARAGYWWGIGIFETPDIISWQSSAASSAVGWEFLRIWWVPAQLQRRWIWEAQRTVMWRVSPPQTDIGGEC